MPEITQKTIQYLESLVLPKWPQMLVWGKKISSDLALDIIFRTDTFLTSLGVYMGGNNKAWNAWARKTMGYDKYLAEGVDLHFKYAMEEALRKAMDVISTEYVHNTWASSCYILGPYGWCHPDGTIWYSHNIGKDPGAREVLEEWQALAAAFPYLDLTVTLMSGEEVEEDTHPVVSFRVANGEVAVLEAPVMPPEEAYPEPKDEGLAVLSLDNPMYGLGLNDQLIVDYGKRTTALLAELEPKVRKEFQKLQETA